MRLSMPVKGALIYALFGMAWIIGSDELVRAFVTESDSTTFQTGKGLFYVGLTAALAYYLLSASRRRRMRDEHRFRTLFNSSPDAILILDENGIVRDANVVAANYYGKPVEELAGSAYTSLTASDETRQELDLTGWPLGKVIRTQGEHKAADGHSFPVEIVTKVIEQDGHRRALLMVRDITEIKKTAAELEASERRYRRYVNEAPIPIIMTTLDARFTLMNAAGCGLLGYDSEELRDRSLFDAACPDNRDRFGSAFEALVRDGRYEGELTFCMKDGSPIDMLVSAFRPDPDQCVLFLLDITERRKLEQQVEHAARMEAVGRLAGGVAHDLNNLLQIINGYSEFLLASKEMAGDVHNSVAKIDGAGNRAAALVRQLLAFSRKQAHTPSIVDANAVIGDLLKLIGRTIGEDIRVEFLPNEDPMLMQADTGQLEQIIMNLCVNARDAMPEGGTLSISTRRGRPDNTLGVIAPDTKSTEFVEISVRDSGCGMDEQTREKIFEPFFTTKSLGKGTGLGLSIVYGLVKQHEGYIEVDSRPNEGTTFHLYFPAAPNNARVGDFERPTPLANGSGTILLAEDDDLVRDYVIRVLESAGYNVIAVNNGAQAVETGRTKLDSIDLFIFDLVMPHMGGRAARAELSRLKPGIKSLFVSGFDRRLENEAPDESEDFVLNKPFSRRELLDCVQQLMQKGALADPACAVQPPSEAPDP